MTVPITPGPWSFLANIGQGIANYGEGKAKHRAEALKQVGTIFDAVQNNQLSTSALKSPFFMNLIKESGIAEQFSPDYVAPKPTETLAKGQEAALGQVLPQILNPAAQGTEDQQARATLAQGKIALPSETATARETTAKARTRAGVIEQGGAAGRAVAEVPSEQIAAAAEQGALQPIVTGAAGRSVDAALTTLKVDRIEASNTQNISDAAWGLAQSDAASKGYVLDESLTRPYIDAAIQQRVRAQEDQDIKRLAAQNAGGANAQNQLYNYYQRQQQRVNDAIRSLPVPSVVDTFQASQLEKIAKDSGRTIEQVLADPNIPSMQKQAYTKVQNYNTQLPSLQREAAGYRDQIGQLLGGQLGVEAGNTAPPPVSTTRTNVGDTTGPAGTTQQNEDLARRRQAASQRLAELRAANAKLPQDKQKADADLIQQSARENGISIATDGTIKLLTGANRK